MSLRKRYPDSNLDVRVWPHRMGHGTCILVNQYKSMRTLVKEYKLKITWRPEIHENITQQSNN